PLSQWSPLSPRRSCSLGLRFCAGISLESIETQDVLSNDHQTGFGADAGGPSSVEPRLAAVSFAVCVGEFDGLAAESIAGSNFRVGHLSPLIIQQFLAF